MSPGLVGPTAGGVVATGRVSRLAGATTAGGFDLAAPIGGADRDRTGDLRLAKAALYQLSYSPGRVPAVRRTLKERQGICWQMPWWLSEN